MKTIHYAIPAVGLVILSTVLLLIGHQIWAVGIAIGIVALVGLFALKDAIDWKYYLRHPPKLEPPILRLLAQVPFYKQLDDSDKIKFEQRLGLFMLAHDYQIPAKAGADDDSPMEAPEDFKALASVSAVMLCFDYEDYLIPEIEKVVLYHHPFPSPMHQIVHNSELNTEDKVIIISVPHLRKGVLEPHIYFDLSMYEWARARNRQLPSTDWVEFESIFGIKKAQAELSIGLPDPEVDAVKKVFDMHRSYLKLLA